ncbi:MAG: chemotaxis protein [Thermodesulfobacteriota bacterium]
MNGEILLESGTNELEIIEFFILSGPSTSGEDRHHFGINVAKVLEVIENPGLVPGRSAVDDSFMGTIALRGQVLPVIDLSVWLGLERRLIDHEVILVTEFNNTIMGFLASGVTQIHRVSWRDVESPGKFLNSLDRSTITGIVHFEDHSLLMLDLESFLAGFSAFDAGFQPRGEACGECSHTALVVDDSQLMRRVVSDCLAGSNFRIVTASNGEEAWNMLKNRQDPADGGHGIDIVVSDIEMPLMDGMALTKRIKSDPGLKSIPVILFSSIISDSLRHKGESVGADCQISKPEFPELAARAMELVGKSRSAPAD